MKTNARETLRLWLVYENANAIRVATGPNRAPRMLWLPRSLIDRLSKFPKTEPLTYQPIELTLPGWKIEQENLWDFVTS